MKEKYYGIDDNLNALKDKSEGFISDKILEMLKVKVDGKIVYVKNNNSKL